MTEETYNLLEEAAQDQLKNITIMDASSKEGKEALAKSIHLVELLIATDKDNAEYYDNQEKRKIEKERYDAANEIERDKQKITFGRAALELGKVIVPLAIQIVAYSGLQRRMFKFEETGRISSTGGREMHLPKFWK